MIRRIDLAVLFLFVVSLPVDAAPQRNVLLLISDNHSWYDCGCYGNPVVRTPHLDQLAADGVRFREGFATTASCGPSRAVMYTGLLTHANGQYAHPHREHNQQLREDVVTIFSMVKENGYRTGLIGKDHIKPLEKYPLDVHDRRGSRDVVAMGEKVDAFLAGADTPFFLVVSFHDPHPTSIDGAGWGITKPTPGYEPVTYPPRDVIVPPFLPDNPEVREGIAGYYQQISRMDTGVGNTLKALEANGHRDDTLVIFIADHGTSEPGAMGTHYEPGVRVPFIVRKPGMSNPGLVNEALVTFADLTPTILDWTETPFDGYRLHGRSFLPILDAPDAPGWDTALLSHVAHDVFAYYPMRTLRTKRYKLIWNVNWRSEYPLPIDAVQRRTWVANRESGAETIGLRTIEDFLHRPRLELYDLENDPWEATNLAEDPKHAERARSMAEELATRLEEQGDPWMRKFHPWKREQ